MERPRFNERISRRQTTGGRPVQSEGSVCDLWEELFRVKADIMKLAARVDTLRDEIRAEREVGRVVENGCLGSADGPDRA